MKKINFYFIAMVIIFSICSVNIIPAKSPEGVNTFIEDTTSLAPVYSGTCKWVDYDNDNDLDVFIMGFLELSDSSGRVVTSKEITRIYQNNDGDFTDIEADLPGLYLAAADWGDYDNDGDLDVIICGTSGSTYVTKIFNNDAGNFIEYPDSLQQVRYGSVAWGDYDNDGDLDILLSGSISTDSSITKLYRNDSCEFRETPTNLVGVCFSSVVWGDYDNDADLDILISGSSRELGLVTKLYRNDNGEFVDMNVPLAGVHYGNNEFGDYDNDGDLDILEAGCFSENISTEVCKIYRNDDGLFTNIDAPLASVTSASVDWGDYDNDGDLDIVLVGYNSLDTTHTGTIYENRDGEFFSTGINLLGLDNSSVDWGDYDNDGDLDILVCGINYNFGGVTKLYRNDTDVSNTAPEIPQNLNASIDGNKVVFSWDKATDVQSEQNALTYNIRVGTKSGGQEIMSAMSELTTGYRLKPEAGNVSHNTAWTINNVQSDKIFWTVQAVDNNYTGSLFATEQEIVLTSNMDDNQKLSSNFKLSQNYPNPFNPTTTIKYNLPQSSVVSLQIFNSLGENVKTLYSGLQTSGTHEIVFDGSSLPSGIYFYQITTRDFRQIKKCLLLK